MPTPSNSARDEALMFGYFPGRAGHHFQLSHPTMSWPMKRPTRWSTACAAAIPTLPHPTRRPFTRALPTSWRCCRSSALRDVVKAGAGLAGGPAPTADSWRGSEPHPPRGRHLLRRCDALGAARSRRTNGPRSCPGCAAVRCAGRCELDAVGGLSPLIPYTVPGIRGAPSSW